MTINNKEIKWFFLIDKPLNITSFDVLRDLRKKIHIKKMWHTWTLDPLASGLLLVAVWDYTKLIPYFEKDTKEYEFTIALDWTTETLDLEKEVNFISDEKKQYFKENLKVENISEILKNKFSWEIFQTPPKYSALKIWWQKALDLVRAWVDFELKQRKVNILNIEIISFNYPYLTLRAEVSAWTYIRSIAYDLWEILWTWGYITFLRRTKIGKLDMTFAQKLEDFKLENKLDDKILFWKENFITLKDENLVKLDNWLKQNIDLDIPDNENYFIQKGDFITNIVSKNGLEFTPLKKI